MSNFIIVDDHLLFRESIKLLIETEGFGKVIGEAENGIQFLSLLKIKLPDLVIMDIDMPYMNGLEATRIALETYPDLRILLVTMMSEYANNQEIIRSGAIGSILKSSGKKEIEKAILKYTHIIAK